MLLDDLGHILRLNATVPYPFRVDDDADTSGTIVETTCLVGAHAPMQAALAQFDFERLDNLGSADRGAAAAWIALRPLVGADEDVPFKA